MYQRNRVRAGLSLRALAALTLACASPLVQADNAALQALFFSACDNPSGALADRCAETPGGTGDLSGDSESSLNPSQTLGATSASYSAARARGEEARERAERVRKEGEDAPGEALSLGPFSLLVNGNYLGEERDRTVDVDTERGYQLDAWRAQVGIDRRMNPRLVVGGLLSWETSELDFDQELPGVGFTPVGRAGRISEDRIGGTLYGNLQLGDSGYLDLAGGYVASDFTVARRAVFQESGRTVPQTLVATRATPDGSELWAAATLGFQTSQGAWSLNPYLGTTVSRVKVDGYRERDLNGSGLAMTVDDLTSRSVLGQVGVRASRAVSREGYVLLPQLSVEYVHEFRRSAPDTRVAYELDQNGNALVLDGERRESGLVDVGLGIVLLLPNGWMPFLEYQQTFGDGDLERRYVTLGLRVEL